MKYDKKYAIKLIVKKIKGTSFLTYEEIATITGYHPKYILKLKKQLLNNTIKIEHGNKSKVPVNKISLEEEQKIINLYKRSNTSIRKFSKFYGTRSYSCIYNILEKNGLLK